MKITKLSTKGQVVIPDIFREGLEVGTSFAVTKKGNLIVLKVLSGLSLDEEKELKELEKIWKDIGSGKAITQSKEDFLSEFGNW